MNRDSYVVVETEDEEVLRKRLLRRLQRIFRDGGYAPYYEELKNYKLDVDEDLEAPGMIDTTNKVIHIRKDVLDNGSDDEISMLLRHELLHSLLFHVERATKFYARELGIAPTDITRKDMRLIKRKMTKPLDSWGEYSAPVAFNIGGDGHLSQYYDEIDKKLTQDPQSLLFGGLIMDEHPEWVGKTFEAILREIIKGENILQRRLSKKIYGHYVDEDNFVVDREEESEFDTSTEIMKEDIVSVDIWDVDSFERDANRFSATLNEIQESYCYVKFDSDDQESYKRIPIANLYDHRIVPMEVKVANAYRFPVIPIFKVRYLHLYKTLQERRYIMCCGLPCVQLDVNRLIAIEPAFTSGISRTTDFCDGFKGSVVESQFNKWKENVGL